MVARCLARDRDFFFLEESSSLMESPLVLHVATIPSLTNPFCLLSLYLIDPVARV